MRLIHVYNLELQDLIDPPPYAILSHRWTNDELSYQAYHGSINQDSATSSKVLSFCKAVRAANASRKEGELLLEWVWVDTCCIDKASSAELSEAINSMWSWYEKSVCCYAYLVDVPWSENRAELLSRFRESSWFRRGWTLQELLAPKKVIFYTSDWRIIGCCPGSSFEDIEILEAVCTASGIDLPHISHAQSIFSACVAERMSWASRRKTTRSEDTAYCLLGIFAIHMPLLYGEGENAFLRLQQEIIRQTNDETIFARALIGSKRQASVCHESMQGRGAGLLAIHSVEFQGCANIRLVDREPRRPFQVTHKGLEMLGPGVEIESCRSDRGSKSVRRRLIIKLNCVYLLDHNLVGPVSYRRQRRAIGCSLGLQEIAPNSGAFYREVGLHESILHLTDADVEARYRHGKWKQVEDMRFYIAMSQLQIQQLQTTSGYTADPKAFQIVDQLPQSVAGPSEQTCTSKGSSKGAVRIYDA